jgi:hypothetical protein
MPVIISVPKLLKEKDRLEAIIAEGATATAKIKEIDRMIALYGDGPTDEYQCPRRSCDRAFPTEQGLKTHIRRIHIRGGT